MTYNGPLVLELVPDAEEAQRALFRMRSRQAPGLTNIMLDHLKEW